MYELKRTESTNLHRASGN